MCLLEGAGATADALAAGGGGALAAAAGGADLVAGALRDGALLEGDEDLPCVGGTLRERILKMIIAG